VGINDKKKQSLKFHPVSNINGLEPKVLEYGKIKMVCGAFKKGICALLSLSICSMYRVRVE
jgi:hypothetical protein